MVDKTLIGRKFEPFQYTVEKNKIREFCLAIGDSNPLFLNKGNAQAEGHPDTPIPLSFPTLFTFWGFPQLWENMRSAGIDTGKLLHMKEEYLYHKPIYPGTTVHGQMEISDVRPGKLNMVTFETTYTNDHQEPVLTTRMTIVVKTDQE